ncbi:MAG: hypothetical protein A2289_15120 [Deltaproteobacteria bacterium RIFOXYA12_FULL_58_15]|nr:MAG: hypothetical protein A2289_15120 [Deltaproteobacteria bacterium RIFOXYA12_FULL_58_15]
MPRASLARRLFVVAISLGLVGGGCAAKPAEPPLWADSKFTVGERDRAILRGLDFIEELVEKDKPFDDNIGDLLWCHYAIEATTPDANLRELAGDRGREMAKRWKKGVRGLPLDANIFEVWDLASTLYVAESLGVRHDDLRAQLEPAIAKYSAKTWLGFDPQTDAPPNKTYTILGKEACIAANAPRIQSATIVVEDIEEVGAKGRAGKRGSGSLGQPVKASGGKFGSSGKTGGGKLGSGDCPKVKVTMTNLDVFYDAMITTYFGDRFGVTHGATFADFTQWIPQLYPYATQEQVGSSVFYDLIYTVTHIVYTHNDYGKKRIDPADLPEEFRFLRETFTVPLEDNDCETFAEYVDTLKSFGVTPEADVNMARAIESLMSLQNFDGSWGDPFDNVYNRFHTTWTAIEGLRDYRFDDGDR